MDPFYWTVYEEDFLFVDSCRGELSFFCWTFSALFKNSCRSSWSSVFIYSHACAVTNLPVEQIKGTGIHPITPLLPPLHALPGTIQLTTASSLSDSPILSSLTKLWTLQPLINLALLVLLTDFSCICPMNWWLYSVFVWIHGLPSALPHSAVLSCCALSQVWKASLTPAKAKSYVMSQFEHSLTTYQAFNKVCLHMYFTLLPRIVDYFALETHLVTVEVLFWKDLVCCWCSYSSTYLCWLLTLGSKT